MKNNEGKLIEFGEGGKLDSETIPDLLLEADLLLFSAIEPDCLADGDYRIVKTYLDPNYCIYSNNGKKHLSFVIEGKKFVVTFWHGVFFLSGDGKSIVMEPHGHDPVLVTPLFSKKLPKSKRVKGFVQ